MQSSSTGGVRRTVRRLATVAAAAGLAAAVAGTATAAEASGPAAPGATTRATAGTPQGEIAAVSALTRASTSKVASLPLNALDSKGNLCSWNPLTTAGGGFAKGTCYSGYGWVNGAVAGSVNGDSTEDVFVRSSSTGHLYGIVSGVKNGIDEGRGWNGYTSIVMPGNLGGSASDDILGRDKSGALWLHQGNSNGHLSARIKVSSGGWNTYRAIFGKFDYNGDGRTDVLGVDYNNAIWVHLGSGDVKHPFTKRVRIVTNFKGYNYVASTGDVNRDNRSDFLARDTNGVLWLFRGYNRLTSPFAARYSLGSALKSFKLIF
ncbi:FG-GAP repeat domain-containing protein [Peterkaempfera griseoplana]|uniref:FG-GAP repeat domain-containing protein n=1 Tax=Peterkaempfera griseoplana TaxID=66896 RepID=UPI0006E46DED|nr:VCBS repeat-containing protein [Peterkaempfera griseoplana]